MSVKTTALANLRGGNNLFQSAFWGCFKALYGWKPYGFSLDWNGAHGKLLALVRELGSGFKVVYVPHGPDVDIPEESYGLFLEELSQELEGARAMQPLQGGRARERRISSQRIGNCAGIPRFLRCLLESAVPVKLYWAF